MPWNKKLALRAGAPFVAILMVTALIYPEAQSSKMLTAPTFYIAASGEYDNYSTTLDVKGASNLPSRSRLSVALYDFIGYRSSILSDDAVVTLKRDGFFEVTLKPRQGKNSKKTWSATSLSIQMRFSRTHRC